MFPTTGESRRPLTPRMSRMPASRSASARRAAGAGGRVACPRVERVEGTVRRMATIWLLGFQGAGKSGYLRYIDSAPLLVAGHVGISWDAGRSIYGFTPHAPGLTSRQILEALRAGGSFDGIVADDHAVFALAAREAAAGYLRSPVYAAPQTVTDARLRAIEAAVRAGRAASPVRDLRYRWPQSGDRPGHNCATWPGTLGLALPEPSGLLARYIPALVASAGAYVWNPP